MTLPRSRAKPKPFVSVGTKLTLAMLVVLFLVSAVAYHEVSQNERQQLLSAKARAAAMVTELFAAGVTAPLSFGDERGVGEHIALLMANANVVYGAVWAVDGAHPGDRGEKLGEMATAADIPDPPRSVPTRVVVERNANVIVVEQPVVGASGEVLGVARAAFSLQPENAAIAAAKWRTLATSFALGLGLAAVLLVLSRSVVVRRLAQLANAAKRLEDGETVDVDVDTNDEVGRLARAFTTMSAAIAARESRISARNRDLRRVLDNVAEGLMTVTRDGVLSSERSRALDDWFGAPAEGSTVFDYFDHFAPTVARFLRVAWQSIDDDFMPVEVILDQMPKRFDRGGRFYELDYLPIWGGREAEQVLDEVLIVVRDVTATVEREQAERGQREALRMFRQIVIDPAAFRDFFQRAAHLVDEIEQNQTDLSRAARDIHTLNGNAGFFGLESVTAACFRIESRMQDDPSLPTAEEIARLRAAWDQVRSLSEQLATPSADDRVELRVEEYERHIADIEANVPHRDLALSARNWSNELASSRLRRIVEQGRSVARRVGKAETVIEARAMPSNLRLPAKWAPFWSAFVHVLRNTFDHGVESPPERVAANKTPVGKVEITLTASRTGVELRVVDDGRGIQWSKVRERAVALGLPHATEADLEQALYVDRVTTRAVATEISGRGVGLGAVRDTVHACGGTIAIESEPGVGTTFRFQFPLSMLDGPRLPPSSAPAVAMKIAYDATLRANRN